MSIRPFKSTCSQCGKVYRGNSRGEVLDKIRKHMWKEHGEWLRSRIRKGVRRHNKQAHAPGNPFIETVRKVLNPSWTGFAERPLIEKVTGRPYEQVRQETLDAFVNQAFMGVPGLVKKLTTKPKKR